ncbi:uncharacterized protein LOC127060960 [Serinus canaria]|uniref:uncharacterized protein LOC127060960 n=1 Tax=Serinus canaria TaxID=9135 RepID=UPI0021CC8926|nr:uncharacterized protein LOC127060960 [Serinus canaria]
MEAAGICCGGAMASGGLVGGWTAACIRWELRKRRCAETAALRRNAGRDGVSHGRLLCRGDRGQLGVCCMRLNGGIGGQGSRGNVQKGRWGRQRVRGGGGRGLDHHRRWVGRGKGDLGGKSGCTRGWLGGGGGPSGGREGWGRSDAGGRARRGGVRGRGREDGKTGVGDRGSRDQRDGKGGDGGRGRGDGCWNREGGGRGGRGEQDRGYRSRGVRRGGGGRILF